MCDGAPSCCRVVIVLGSDGIATIDLLSTATFVSLTRSGFGFGGDKEVTTENDTDVRRLSAIKIMHSMREKMPDSDDM